MEALNELTEFIKPDSRLDVKTLALHHVLSLTGNFESRNLLLSHPKILTQVVILAFKKDEQKSIAKDSFFTLINMAAEELNAKRLMEKNPVLVRLLIEYILDENSKFSDTACAILSNLSRGKKNSEMIFSYFDSKSNDSNNNDTKGSFSLEQLLTVFCTEKFNKTNRLDYLAPFICNLTQLEQVREMILNENILLLRLLPYTTYTNSTIRRGGIVGAIKNCCFNYDYHEKLLFTPEIDLLSRLLLPLAGPEEFDAEDNDKLPDDLQYLPPDKQREDDADIRTMLLETLMMLCSHKKCREYIRDKNSYIILREFFNWEEDLKVAAVAEKIISVLIADEPEEGMETLHKVEIPDELSKKFYEYEKTELEKNFE